MKKVITTMTALVFALGLAATGFAQTATTKDMAKPAVKTQAPASGSQVAPVEMDKSKEALDPVTKEGEAVKSKKDITMVNKKDSSKKNIASAPETKKEAIK
jgi:hypothetical protein